MRAALLLLAIALLGLGAWLLLRERGGPRSDVAGTASRRDTPSSGDTPRLTGTPRSEEQRRPDDPAALEAPAASSVVVRGVVRLRGLGHVVEGSRVTMRGTATSEGESQTDVATTDRNGAYLVHFARGTRLEQVDVSPSQDREAHLPTSSSLDGTALDEERVLDLEVDPGIVVMGRVVDEETRAPLRAAIVHHEGRGRRSVSHAADTGEFRLSGIDPEHLDGRRTLALSAHAPGYVEGRVEVKLVDGAATASDVTIALQAGVTVAGRVVVREGVSAQGLFVRIEERLPGDRGWGRAVRTLARVETAVDGTFRFPAIPPTERADVVVQSENEWGRGFGLGDAVREVDARSDRSDIVLRPARAGRAAVGATYPGGARVLAGQMIVTFRDDGGVRRRTQVSGKEVTYVAGPIGAVVPVDVYARASEPGSSPGESRQRFFRGRGTVTIREATPTYGPEADAVVPLQEVARPEPPWPDELKRLSSMGLDAPEAASYGWLLTFTDAATGEPLAKRRFEIRQGMGSSGSSGLSAQGKTFVAVGLGRSRLHFAVDGYEPVEFEVEPDEPGYEVCTVPLTRAR